MRALKMLLVFTLVLVAGCNFDRMAWNSGLRYLSAGDGVDDPEDMDTVLEKVTGYIQSALTVVPGIILEGPGGQRRLTGTPTDEEIANAIDAVSHRPGERWDSETESYWFRMEKTCSTCPSGWRRLGVNAEPFPTP